MNTSQKLVRRFVRERGWDKQSPDDIAKSISIEAAELLEIFQWESPTATEIKKNPKRRLELGAELADVLIYSLQMANLLDLEVVEIVKNKLAFAAKKYPVNVVKKRSMVETDAHERYLRIKRTFRASKKQHG